IAHHSPEWTSKATHSWQSGGATDRTAMDPDVDELTAELTKLYAEPQPQLLLPNPHLTKRQSSTDSGGGVSAGRGCEDALDELVRELHAENQRLRQRLRSAEAEHGHRVRCLVDTLDKMQKEVAEMATRMSAAVKRPKSDCTNQSTPSSAACCHGRDGVGLQTRRRSLSIGEDYRELASALAHACEELRAENACLMQQLRRLRSHQPAVPNSRASQRRRELRRCQAEEELAEMREELHRLRVAVLEASVRFPGVEALLLKP
ncbi:hypothetical protein BOX15_Mlig034167g1, partial [Macrostomum lignano]